MKLPSFKKAYLFTYRGTGFAIMSFTLAALGVYGFLMMFFFFNSTWIAPTVLSPTSDRMLQFSAGYQQAVQTYETLKVTEAKAERDRQYANFSLIALKLSKAELNQQLKNIDVLTGHKVKDLSDSNGLLTQLNGVKAQTQASRKAGLITNEDATQTVTAIQQFRNGTTDGGLTLSTARITLTGQVVQLEQAIQQAQNDERTATDTIASTKTAIDLARAEVLVLNNTSYMHAMKDGANLAFVSYDNLKNIKAGEPIYDCYLLVILCHKVGTVGEVYKDEQLVDFPIFNVRFSRTVRGVMSSLDMDGQKPMSSSILFVGSKPLFL